MAFRVEGPVVIRVVIDEEGDLHEPRVVKPLLAPTLSYTVLEAVKLWVFEPAKLAGEPISIVYNLTANFEWR